MLQNGEKDKGTHIKSEIFEISAIILKKTL
jgi:hypothetical protein